MRELPLPIPSSIQPYFQVYGLADLHLRRDANLIIQRILDYGTWDEVRWLFQTYSRQHIRRFLARMPSVDGARPDGARPKTIA